MAGEKVLLRQRKDSPGVREEERDRLTIGRGTSYEPRRPGGFRFRRTQAAQTKGLPARPEKASRRNGETSGMGASQGAQDLYRIRGTRRRGERGRHQGD